MYSMARASREGELRDRREDEELEEKEGRDGDAGKFAFITRWGIRAAWAGRKEERKVQMQYMCRWEGCELRGLRA